MRLLRHHGTLLGANHLRLNGHGRNEFFFIYFFEVMKFSCDDDDDDDHDDDDDDDEDDDAGDGDRESTFFHRKLALWHSGCRRTAKRHLV